MLKNELYPPPPSTTTLALRDIDDKRDVRERFVPILIAIVNNVLHAVENRCTYMITYPFAVCRCRRLSRIEVS